MSPPMLIFLPLDTTSLRGVTPQLLLDSYALTLFAPTMLYYGYTAYNETSRRKSSWALPLLVCLFRLVGAIASITSLRHPSSMLGICYDVADSFVLWAVMYTILQFLHRFETGMAGRGMPRPIFELLSLLAIASLVLSTVGSVKSGSEGSWNASRGSTYSKTGTSLFSLVYIASVFIAVHTSWKIRPAQAGEYNKLMHVTWILHLKGIAVLFSLYHQFAKQPLFSLRGGWGRALIFVQGLIGLLTEIYTIGELSSSGCDKIASVSAATSMETYSPPPHDLKIERSG